MRLTILLMTVALVQVSARGLTQTTVTYSAKSEKLESVLTAVKKKTGYFLFYNKSLLVNTQPVTVELKDKPLEEALNEIFKNQPLSYSIEGKTIVISEKKESGKKLDLLTGGLNPRLEAAPPPSIDVTITVLNTDNQPLEGASIIIKGSNKGIATDVNGRATLRGVDANATIIISFTGYASQEYKLASNPGLKVGVTNLTALVRLVALTSELDQVQIIAYGQTTKRLNTGNVSTVKASTIEKQPVSNPLLALQGRIPGMQIAQENGLPGASVSIKIRGTNNIRGSNDPLFIIDGVPYQAQNNFGSNGGGILGSNSGSPFNYINPSDIESIDILKDADATSIYGSRGANGVVLINTKKGKAGQTRIDLNVQRGFGQVRKKLKVLDTRQYLDMRYEAIKNDGASIDPDIHYDLALWDTTRNTDWQKELIGGKAIYNDVKLSVSGGSTNTQFLIGSGYHKETTVLPGDFKDEKASIHFSIDNRSPNEKFKIALSGFYLYDNNDICAINLAQVAVQMMPNAPSLYNSDGSLNWAPNRNGSSSWPGGSNPAALLTAKYNSKTNNLVSNGSVSYLLLPNLDIKSTFSYSNTHSNGIYLLPLSYFDPSKWATIQRSSIFSTSDIHSWIIEPQLNYSIKTKWGVLKALVGTTIQQSRNSQETLNAVGFNSDQVMRNISSATSVTVNSSTNSLYKYNALFGRLNFNREDKYLINLTARRDGSSRFGPANQFHNFVAIGSGWVFSKEKAFHSLFPFISFGKLRGSYGTTGSDDIGDYTFMDLYSTVSNIGVPYQGANGILPNRLYTPDLKWQETKKLEGGLDLGFLNDRIYFSASYYRNRSSNQLLDQSLSGVTGFTAIYKNLSAVVQNKGVEFGVDATVISTKNFRFKSSLNFTFNKNKLLSGSSNLNSYLQQKIGYSLQTNFVYRFLNVDPFTGVYTFADHQGNSTTHPDAATDAIVPIDLNPTFYGGFQNNLSFKGFELDFLFQFSKKPNALLYLYNSIPGYTSSTSFGANQPTQVLERWRKPGDVKPYQRYSQNLSLLNSKLLADGSNLAYGDGLFITLRNASLIWQIPAKWKAASHLQNAAITVQGQNLFCISKQKNALNPEDPSSIVVPPLRVITVGFKITF